MTERHRFATGVIIAEAAANLILNLLLLKPFGMRVVIWNGLVIKIIIAAVIILPYLLRCIRIPAESFSAKSFTAFSCGNSCGALSSADDPQSASGRVASRYLRRNGCRDDLSVSDIILCSPKPEKKISEQDTARLPEEDIRKNQESLAGFIAAVKLADRLLQFLQGIYESGIVFRPFFSVQRQFDGVLQVDGGREKCNRGLLHIR